MRAPTRRAATAAAALALAAACSGCSRRPPAYDKQPNKNVLLITIDTLRADALGSYGGQARTPEPRFDRRQAACASILHMRTPS